MPKHDVRELPVLIVGAGPAGLITATTLARYGIESLLVERRPGLSSLPRANGASTWSMELLRTWGLEGEVRASAVDAEPRGWIAETLVDPDGVEMPASFPSLEQSAAVSPSAPAVIGQDELEPIVLRHLRAAGTGEVRFGTELVAVEITADGVRATIRDAVNGVERQVIARYLVAGDGAHSRIRQTLGIEMHGPGRVADAISAIFHAPLWDVVDNRRYAIYPVSHPDPRGVFVAVSRKNRWVFGVTRDPGELDPAEFGKEAMARLIVEASGIPGLNPRIERVGTFTYFAGVAERFREGPVLLAGDAAHRVTPRGATGMNAAIRDGYDLGWKLAWVLRGWAEDGLLDTYEAERRPAVEHNLARSSDSNGSQRDVADELHVDLGGRIAHVWLRAGDERISTLDLVGGELTLFTGPGGVGSEPAVDPAYGSAPVSVRELPAVVARGLGIAPGGSLLVRPDGVPAALGIPHLVERASRGAGRGRSAPRSNESSLAVR